MAGISSLKAVKVTICEIKCFNLTKETIFGGTFSYNKNLQLESNFRKYILSIERILKTWRRRNLKLEGKVIIFKTLALSIVTFLAQVLVIPNQIIDALQQIQKDFLWNSSFPKVNMKPIAKIFNMDG